MARVQMLQHISGGRADNTEWPHRMGFLDCDDDEAESLVRGGNARWPEKAPDEAERPAAAPAKKTADDEPSEPEKAPETPAAPKAAKTA